MDTRPMAAGELRDGEYGNLNIGIPTLVANHPPTGIHVTLPSENGIFGMGPSPFEGHEDADVSTRANKRPPARRNERTVNTLIAGYARTPFLKFNGAFADISGARLGSIAVAAALAKSGLEPDCVERVFVGQVLQGGAGQNPARQTAIGAGVPFRTPAITLNAVCLSGMEAIAAGVQLIDAGDADVVVAVGQESMSRAPHAWLARSGTKYGSLEILDTMDHDGLTDAFENRSMGASTEEHNIGLNISRADQDAWSAESHRRLSISGEFLDGEITSVTVSGRAAAVITSDDGLRPGTTTEKLAALPPAFAPEGTITAGNSSQITDGAAAVALVSESFAADRGLHCMARVISHAIVAGPDVSLQAQPANATRAALAKTEYTTHDLAAVEINEAFAAVAVHSTRLLDLNPNIVNRHGGAIALGHPIGASGARIVGHLARRLGEQGPGAVGAASICGGGGQGSAVILIAV